MKYTFERGWKNRDFDYVYSPACQDYKTFRQENDCIVNGEGKDLMGYEYISFLTKRKYGEGVKLTAHCSFEKFGAPLIVISNDVREKEDKKIYGVHFEVVAYKKGCNIWYIVPDANSPLGRTSTLIGKLEFRIEGGSELVISAEIKDEKIFASVNGNSLVVEHRAIPQSFHVGFTACEGINRFYGFTVEE